MGTHAATCDRVVLVFKHPLLHKHVLEIILVNNKRLSFCCMPWSFRGFQWGYEKAETASNLITPITLVDAGAQTSSSVEKSQFLRNRTSVGPQTSL